MLYGYDRLGRRRSLLIGSIRAGISLWYLDAYTKLFFSFDVSTGNTKKSASAYVTIVMIYPSSVFYAVSWNGIPWIFWCSIPFPPLNDLLLCFYSLLIILQL